MYWFIVSEDAEIPVSITTFLQYLLSINKKNSPDWDMNVKPVSVISVSSTGLDLLIMKTLVSRKWHSFDKTKYISILIMKPLVSAILYDFDQIGVYLY